MLLLPRWILGQLLHPVWIRHIAAFLYCWAGVHSLDPCFEVGELGYVDAGPECACYPAELRCVSVCVGFQGRGGKGMWREGEMGGKTYMGNISNGASISNEITGCGLLKMGVENSIKAAGLVLIAVYTIFNCILISKFP